MQLRHVSPILGALGCALLLGVALLPYAQAGSGETMTGALLAANTARIEELRAVFLPALHRHLLSLTLKDAPIPQELADLLAHSQALRPEELRSFEQHAERVLGSSWEDTFAGEKEQAGTAAERLRAYLARIIEEAPVLSERRSHSAEEIRVLATDLMRRVQEAEGTGEVIATLVPLLRDRLADIFPDEHADSLEAFRSRAERILLELPDAIALLLSEDNRKRAALTARASALYTSLALLHASRDIMLFRTYFTVFEGDLLASTPEIPLAQLRLDFEALLQNLAATLRDAEHASLPVSASLDAVTALLDEVRHMEDESDVRATLARFEDILNVLRATEASPPASQTP